MVGVTATLGLPDTQSQATEKNDVRETTQPDDAGHGRMKLEN
jgi:hypothetical protein